MIELDTFDDEYIRYLIYATIDVPSKRRSYRRLMEINDGQTN
jgi:hypothetical protein